MKLGIAMAFGGKPGDDWFEALTDSGPMAEFAAEQAKAERALESARTYGDR